MPSPITWFNGISEHKRILINLNKERLVHTLKTIRLYDIGNYKLLNPCLFNFFLIVALSLITKVLTRSDIFKNELSEVIQ